MATETTEPTEPTANPTAVPDTTPSCTCPDLSNIQIVDIDTDGIYKYIAFTVRDPAVKTGSIPIIIVRGYKRFHLFEEIIDEVQEKLQPLISEPFVGGFINHNSANNTIHIFGTALGVDKGTPDRRHIAKLVRQQYPGFKVTIGAKDIAPLPAPATPGALATPGTPAAPAPPAPPAP